MKNSSKGILSAVIGFVIIGAIAAYVSYTRMDSFRFFYPDRNYAKLRSEWRGIRLVEPGTPQMELLVREYLLGPLDYRMMMNIDPDTRVLNVWYVKGDDHDKEAVFVNFGGNFSNNIVFNNESYGWMVKGLLKTLKVNTGVKRLYIMAYGKMQQLYLGDYDIYYPIRVDESGF